MAQAVPAWIILVGGTPQLPTNESMTTLFAGNIKLNRMIQFHRMSVYHTGTYPSPLHPDPSHPNPSQELLLSSAANHHELSLQ